MTEPTIDELKDKINQLEIINSGLLMERDGYQALIGMLRTEIETLKKKVELL